MNYIKKCAPIALKLAKVSFNLIKHIFGRKSLVLFMLLFTSFCTIHAQQVEAKFGNLSSDSLYFNKSFSRLYIFQEVDNNEVVLKYRRNGDVRTKRVAVEEFTDTYKTLHGWKKVAAWKGKYISALDLKERANRTLSGAAILSTNVLDNGFSSGNELLMIGALLFVAVIAPIAIPMGLIQLGVAASRKRKASRLERVMLIEQVNVSDWENWTKKSIPSK